MSIEESIYQDLILLEFNRRTVFKYPGKTLEEYRKEAYRNEKSTKNSKGQNNNQSQADQRTINKYIEEIKDLHDHIPEYATITQAHMIEHINLLNLTDTGVRFPYVFYDLYIIIFKQYLHLAKPKKTLDLFMKSWDKTIKDMNDAFPIAMRFHANDKKMYPNDDALLCSYLYYAEFFFSKSLLDFLIYYERLINSYNRLLLYNRTQIILDLDLSVVSKWRFYTVAGESLFYDYLYCLLTEYDINNESLHKSDNSHSKLYNEMNWTITSEGLNKLGDSSISNRIIAVTKYIRKIEGDINNYEITTLSDDRLRYEFIQLVPKLLEQRRIRIPKPESI